METMAERIKRLRLEHNLTQEELGVRVGLKRAAINKYEKGNVENMKRSVIEKMSAIFGVTPSYLMAIEDTASPIEKIYNELEPSRQKSVYEYAKDQLHEQNSKDQLENKNQELFKELEEFIDEFGIEAFENIHKVIESKRSDKNQNLDAG
ncbi:SOS-response repressor and protease LexA [Enterococcus casseliflavus]|nr:SOS-response repressor and protease LexA [Enterococcus casseliflavus]